MKLNNIRMAFGDAKSPTALSKEQIETLLHVIDDSNVTKAFSGHISLATGSITAGQEFALGVAGITYHGAAVAEDFNVYASKTSIIGGESITFTTDTIPAAAMQYSVREVKNVSGALTKDQIKDLVSFNGSIMTVADDNLNQTWNGTIVVACTPRYSSPITKTVEITAQGAVRVTGLTISGTENIVARNGVATQHFTIAYTPSDYNVTIGTPVVECNSELVTITNISKTGFTVNVEGATESFNATITATNAGVSDTFVIAVEYKITPIITLVGDDTFNALNGTGEKTYLFGFNPSQYTVPVSLVSVTSSNTDVKIKDSSLGAFTAYVDGISDDAATTITAVFLVDGEQKTITKSVTAKYQVKLIPFIIMNTTGAPQTFRYKMGGGVTSSFEVAKMQGHVKGTEDYEDVEFTTVNLRDTGVTVTLRDGESFLIQSGSHVPSNSRYLQFVITSFAPEFDGDVLGTCGSRMRVYACYYMFRDCTSLTTAPELPATTLVDRCYSYMFSGCTSLVNAPELPATTLVMSCYSYMFENCTSLVNAPELPATTLKSLCYYYMFKNCTSLTTAPELPATTLETNCYGNMFYGCTSLETAPQLPATQLENSCYSRMFYGCTSLVNAPELPAAELKSNCYNSMFKNCSKLNYIKMLATVNISSALSEWVSGVASTGTFVKHPQQTSLPTGDSGIPEGWTVEDAIID